MRRICTILLLLGALVAPTSAQAAFGVESFDLTYDNVDGSADAQAAAHPFAVTNLLGLTTRVDPELGTVPTGSLKDVHVELPAGLVGNPLATPRCSRLDFLTHRTEPKLPSCANDTAVGTIVVGLYYANNTGQRLRYFSTPVYNLVAPPGTVQELGFLVAEIPVILAFKLSPEPPYNAIAELRYASQVAPVFSSRLVVWGDPASPVHDGERGDCIEPLRSTPGLEQVETDGGSCPSDAPERAFVTLPRACRGALPTAYWLDSWQEPALQVSGPEVFTEFHGCSAVGFAPPAVETEPTTHAADSSSGLDFDLDIDDPGLTDPSKLAQSDIEKTVVTLPRGVTTNPAVAAGLGACSREQYEFEATTLDPAPSGGCPQSSKVGTVAVESPLVEPTIHGSLYVARQRENPFHNLLTLYMVLKSSELGVNIRMAGKVEPDPVTGQLTTTFDELPQLPFSHLHLHIREGSRAPLITPNLCGRYTTDAVLYPYANPSTPVHSTASFEVTAGADGAPCASSQGQLPNAPSFSAGTLSPLAGAYSPFVLRLSRQDGSQQFSSIETTLPEGLLGRLAGTPYCSDAQIAQAASRGGEGEGALEQASPSCPAASEVGTVTVAAGAGPEPYYVTGRAYLAGPYKGAPLSLEIVTPAIAGPFDLGAVAVRTALDVDLRTARVTAISDPIPTILHGLSLDVRSIAIDMDRPRFTLNPTSCEPKQITGSVTSTLNQSTPVGQYFQVEGCGRLKFKPRLRLQLKGRTRRSGHPAVKAVLTYPKKGSYANVARAQVGLPHSEFLDQGNLDKVCTQPQLKSNTCPKRSVYGRVKAWTPLLDKPLEGPVYLGVGFGYKLPALVADLNGQIRVLLVGKVDTDKQHGIRNTFEAVPDAPVSRFVLELKGGPKYGLLENSENICRKPQRASTRFVAQNGRAITKRIPIGNDCGRKQNHKKPRKKHGGGTRRH
ncbi:MAG TPA: hypothetical protein VHB53_04390 [Solirubrobacterales bacterium]|nr:hypothetical protein [Solirubrobacterales bacterium]